MRQGVVGAVILGVGLGILGVGYVLWKLLGQAQNIESAQRLRGLARKPPASDPPFQSTTTTDGNSYISTSTSNSPVTSSASISAGGNVQIGELHHHIHPPPQPKSELLSIPISSDLIASTEGPVATSHSKQDSSQPLALTENRQSTTAGNPCPTNRDEEAALERLQIINELRDRGLLRTGDISRLHYQIIAEIQIARLQE
jgi:hypothetical protein